MRTAEKRAKRAPSAATSSLYNVVVTGIAAKAREDVKALASAGAFKKMPSIRLEELRHHISSRTSKARTAVDDAKGRLASCGDFVENRASAYAKAGKRAKNSVESMLSSGLDAKLREIEDAALAQLASIHQAFKKDLEAVQV